MGKKIRKACAFVLASTVCIQPILAYSQATQVKAEEAKTQTIQVSSEEQSVKKVLASQNATVKGGAYAAISYPGLSVIEVKTANDPDYSKRGYMDFALSEEVHKAIDWENVERITLTLQVKGFYEEGQADTVTFYNTTADAAGQWNEANLTWNNAPKIIPSTQTGSNKIHSVRMTNDQKGQMEIDLTQSLKAHYQTQKAEEGVVRLGIGIGIEEINNRGGLQFYSKHYEGGVYTPYITIYEKENTNPQITMKPVDEVVSGNTFEVELGFKNVAERVYAQDLVVAYDESLFEFVDATGVGNTQVVDKKVESGQVRLLLATEHGAVDQDELVKLRFKPVSVQEETTGKISLAKAELGTVTEGNAQSIQVEGVAQDILIKPVKVEVDKVALQATIAEAQKLSDEAVVGDQIGQYPEAAKAALQEAIQTAIVVENTSENQAEINAATATLKAAIDTFKETQIKGADEDLNQDNVVDIADLALVAYYYQADLSNNEAARRADINKDGEVDIQDLTLVANKILGK